MVRQPEVWTQPAVREGGRRSRSETAPSHFQHDDTTGTAGGNKTGQDGRIGW